MNYTYEGIEENNWILKEIYTREINEEEMKDIINKKLAYIIVEFENNLIIEEKEGKGENDN